MVKGSRGSSSPTSDTPGLVHRLFLAVCCPPLPLLGVDVAARSIAVLFAGLAAPVMALSWLIVPLWLLALRALIQQGMQHYAALVGAGGLALLLLADAAVRSKAKDQQAARRGAVTASNVRDLLPARGAVEVPRFFPVAAGAAGAAATAAAVNQQLHTNMNAQQRIKAGAENRAVAGSSGGEPGEYAQLLPELNSLQRVVFGTADNSGSSSSSTDAKEKLTLGLKRVCDTVGFPLTPAMVESSSTISRTIADLRRHLGCT